MHCDRGWIPVPGVELLVGGRGDPAGVREVYGLLDKPPEIPQGDGLRNGDLVFVRSGHVRRVRFELTTP